MKTIKIWTTASTSGGRGVTFTFEVSEEEALAVVKAYNNREAMLFSEVTKDYWGYRNADEGHRHSPEYLVQYIINPHEVVAMQIYEPPKKPEDD